VSAAPAPRAATIRVWDPLVRGLHGTLAAAVVGAYALGDDGGVWHERFGYVALAAVGVRLAWGFVGSRRARFADFVRGPAAIKAYGRELVAGREPRYLGHNPLGGAWILMLLALVIATGATGWLLSSYGEDEFEALEDAHEVLANGLLLAAAVHVTGVFWESIRHGENLARAMVTGRKREPSPDDR